MKRLLIWLIRLYQSRISALKRQPTCRFRPTCSSYALEALEKRGLFVGSLLAFLRILRCQPFGKAGWDSVPEKGLRNPRMQAEPMTKYYYPQEYGLLPSENEEDTEDQ